MGVQQPACRQPDATDVLKKSPKRSQGRVKLAKKPKGSRDVQQLLQDVDQQPIATENAPLQRKSPKDLKGQVRKLSRESKSGSLEVQEAFEDADSHGTRAVLASELYGHVWE